MKWLIIGWFVNVPHSPQEDHIARERQQYSFKPDLTKTNRPPSSHMSPAPAKPNADATSPQQVAERAGNRLYDAAVRSREKVGQSTTHAGSLCTSSTTLVADNLPPFIRNVAAREADVWSGLEFVCRRS